jgi:excisionase family DNA binding protein
MGAPVQASRLLPVRDVADRLAVSEKTIYRMISAGEPPALHVRGQIRVDPDQLAAWLYGLDRESA